MAVIAGSEPAWRSAHGSRTNTDASLGRTDRSGGCRTGGLSHAAVPVQGEEGIRLN